jgi:hypothetical protein
MVAREPRACRAVRPGRLDLLALGSAAEQARRSAAING